VHRRHHRFLQSSPRKPIDIAARRPLPARAVIHFGERPNSIITVLAKREPARRRLPVPRRRSERLLGRVLSTRAITHNRALRRQPLRAGRSPSRPARPWLSYKNIARRRSALGVRDDLRPMGGLLWWYYVGTFSVGVAHLHAVRAAICFGRASTRARPSGLRVIRARATLIFTGPGLLSPSVRLSVWTITVVVIIWPFPLTKARRFLGPPVDSITRELPNFEFVCG